MNFRDTLEQPTLPHALQRNAAAFGDRDALVCPEGRLSYAQLAADVRALAAWLQGFGLARGERVAMLFPNGSRWVASVLAVQHLGLTAVPLNTWYQSDELEQALLRANARLVIGCDEAIFGRDYPAMLERIVERHRTTISGGLQRWRMADSLPIGVGTGDAGPATTRGTVEVALDTAASLKLGAHERAWMPGPLFFGRQSSNGIGTTLVAGMTLCLQHQFDAGQALRLLERERCSVVFCNGIHARGIASHPDFAKTDLSALRTGTGGANPQEKAFFMDVVGAEQLCAVYGMTETCGVASITLADGPREACLNSAGTPVASQELRIVEDGREQPRGTQGEIQLRGAILAGYLDAELNAKAFTEDGWFRTGDSGWLDEDGRLHYAGRRGDMIKSKGINISPAEVEAAIQKCEGVVLAVVYGVADPVAFERVLCLIVPQDTELLGKGAEAQAKASAFVEGIVESLRSRVASYKVPAEIRLASFDELPLMPTGKVNRRELRARAEAASQ
jgi:acyl-CoA synthetase (AMP-forming)/AMP-acid ligase II